MPNERVAPTLETAKKKIYVAGPYTNGDVAENVHKAIKAANDLADLGFMPFLPHLTHFWHLQHQRPYKFWCELDNAFLPYCDALLRLPGESNGADAEVELAEKLGIPIFYSIKDVAMGAEDK